MMMDEAAEYALKLHYGEVDGVQHSLRKIAKMLNVNRFELKRYARAYGLREFRNQHQSTQTHEFRRQVGEASSEIANVKRVAVEDLVKYAVQLNYGEIDGRQWPIGEIAKEVKLSPSSIRNHIRKFGLRKLRKMKGQMSDQTRQIALYRRAQNAEAEGRFDSNDERLLYLACIAVGFELKSKKAFGKFVVDFVHEESKLCADLCVHWKYMQEEALALRHIPLCIKAGYRIAIVYSPNQRPDYIAVARALKRCTAQTTIIDSSGNIIEEGGVKIE